MCCLSLPSLFPSNTEENKDKRGKNYSRSGPPETTTGDIWVDILQGAP